MNETIQKIRDAIARRVSALVVFWRANRALALGGLTVISILLVVWARLGFTLEIGRFFAYDELSNAPEEEPSDGGGDGGGGTPSTGGGTTAPSDAECIDGKRTVPGGPLCINGVWDPFNNTCTFECSGGVPSAPQPSTQPTGCLANGGQNGGGNPAGDASCDFDGSGCEFGYCQADGNCDIRRSRCDDTGGPVAVQQPPTGDTTAGTQTTTTQTTTVPAPVTLSVQCGSTQNILTWTPNTGAAALTVLKNTDGADGVVIATLPAGATTYTDTQVSVGHAYRYRVKNHPTVSSNFADCPPPVAGTTPSPTATPSPTLAPTATPTPGVSPTPTGTPTPGGAVSLAVTGLNISTSSSESSLVTALGSQEVEVIARIRNDSADALASNISVQAALPTGLAYVPGSTTVNGAQPPVDRITTGGLTLAALGPQQESVVRFRVRVDGMAFPAGQSQTIIVVQVGAEGGAFRSGSLSVFINRPTAGAPGTVPTGPGDAVLVALLVSAATTLLYVSYTRSSAFRRHEAGRVSEDQGPMDFRS